MKKKCLSAAFLITAALMLGACGKDGGTKKAVDYNDGTYTGRSSDFEEDESGNGAGYGEVELVIKDNKISECSFVLYKLDGSVKDETYGADLTKENRLKAQKAVQSADKYAALLVSKGSLDEVDVISGATITYSEFKEAVGNALKSAEK